MASRSFRGLAAVSRQVAWLGGYDGLVLRTTDGGRHWQNVSPPGAGALQFRDISAFDARHAVALSAGAGTDALSDRDAFTVAFADRDPGDRVYRDTDALAHTGTGDDGGGDVNAFASADAFASPVAFTRGDRAAAEV